MTRMYAFEQTASYSVHTCSSRRLYFASDRLDPLTCDLANLNRVAFVTLTFTTQKNSVYGDMIGHARFSHLYACPVIRIVHRVLYLRRHGTSSDAPLCAVHSAATNAWCTISTKLD
jgi:hypothetical protein